MQLLSSKLIGGLNTGRRSIFFQYFLLFISLLLGMMFFGLFRIYGFVVFPDEFGYWSTAAAAVGTDWSQVASMGSYYAFGYSLILTPIMFLFGGGVAAYRIAIVINVLLQCSSLFLLKGIMTILYPRMRRIDAIYCICIAVFYPAWSFYTQMTLAEALIMFLYVLSVYLMAFFLEKPKVWKAFLLLAVLVYMYFVHMRMVGVVVAGFLTFVVWAFRNPKLRKFILIAIVGLGIAGIAAVGIKGIVQGNVYANSDASLLAGNDYAGQIYTIKRLFTLEGIRNLIVGVAGKLFYLVEASFGTLFITLIYLFGQLISLKRKYKEKEEPLTKQLVSFYILLSFAAQFAITAAYMNTPSKLDSITYGRYNDYLIPIIMCLGLRQLMGYRHKLRYFIVTTLISGALCVMTIVFSYFTKLTNMHEYFVAGISYLWSPYSFDPCKDYLKAFLFATFLMAILLGCIHLSRRRGKWMLLLNVILALEVALTLVICSKDIYTSGEIDRIDSGIASYLDKHCSEDSSIYYYPYNGLCIIDVVQFDLDGKIINVIDGFDIAESVKPGDYLIVDSDSDLTFDDNPEYSYKRDTVWFKLFQKK